MRVDEESIKSIQKIIPMLLWVSLFYITENNKIGFCNFIIFGTLFFIGKIIKYLYCSFEDKKFNYKKYYEFMQNYQNEFADYGFSFILFTFIKAITKDIYLNIDKISKAFLFIEVIGSMIVFFILAMVFKKIVLKKYKIKEINIIGFLFIVITFILYLTMGNIKILNGLNLKSLVTEILLIFFVMLPVKGFFLLEKKDVTKENCKLKSKKGLVNSKSVDVIMGIFVWLIILILAYIVFKILVYKHHHIIVLAFIYFWISLYFYDSLDEELKVFSLKKFKN